jgi:uncharacterized protein (DUF433 family)
MSTELLNRITSNPRQCGGRPCIRGMRIRVKDVLDMLAGGASEEEILADFPYLEPADSVARRSLKPVSSRVGPQTAALDLNPPLLTNRDGRLKSVAKPTWLAVD